MATVFFLTKLKEGASRRAYEQWVRDYDYPTCEKHFPSIVSFRNFRADRTVLGDFSYDYLEHIEVTSLAEYERDQEKPEFKELLRQWAEFIDPDSAVVIYGSLVE